MYSLLGKSRCHVFMYIYHVRMQRGVCDLPKYNKRKKKKSFFKNNKKLSYFDMIAHNIENYLEFREWADSAIKHYSKPL